MWRPTLSRGAIWSQLDALIPLPFDKVMEAVLKVKPPTKEAPKPKAKRDQEGALRACILYD